LLRTIRFLADANLNRAIYEGCRRREPAMNFLSPEEADLEGVPDPQVLAIAAREGRVLVTHDFQSMFGHFSDFLSSGSECPGVLLVSQAAAVRKAIDEIVRVWNEDTPEDMKNRILRVDNR
jgi:hypothetical protein